MKREKIQKLLENLPHLPGVYKYFNKEGALIYVGKAKDLRKRVASYFTKEPENRKTFKLIANIDYLEFTIVNTEQDALLLENSLIKHFQPRYNINLKDDKTYPYIVFKNEAFPRVFLTRNIIEDGSEYFGPFTSVVKIRELLELIRDLVPLRKNKTDLFIRLTEKGKLKVSSEYYINDGLEKEEKILTEEEYDLGLNKLRDIIKGKFAAVIKPLRAQRKECIRKMEFEKAEVIQQKIEFIKEYRASGMIFNTKGKDLDIFTIHVNEDQAFVNYLLVRKGAIVKTKTVNYSRNPNESEEEIMTSAIIKLQKEFKSNVNELVVLFPLKHLDSKLTVTIPKKGIKKKLLNLSKKNLDYFIEKPAQLLGEKKANDF